MIIACYENKTMPNDYRDRMMEGPSMNDDFPMGVLHVNDHMQMDLTPLLFVISAESVLNMGLIDSLIEQFRQATNQL